jgi:integrase
MIATTLRGALAHYILYHTLAAETIAWYSRVVSVYCHWADGDVPLGDFNGESISQMLLDKERAGRSPYYLKSLRGGLVAFLREIKQGQPVERVRTIKTPPLDPHALEPEEIEKLLLECNKLPPEIRWRYKLMILLGYYTGLDRADICRMERRSIASDGSIFFRRGKTGSAIYVRVALDVPPLIDKHCPRTGPILKMWCSKETFRKRMREIFAGAGLCGTFKTIRKSSGSLVEQQSPGTGHRHLGNTRSVFERHYEKKLLTRNKPTMPPQIKIG